MTEEITTIAVRLPQSTAERLKAAADADHRTLSSLLRVLIDAEIERHEQKQEVTK